MSDDLSTLNTPEPLVEIARECEGHCSLFMLTQYCLAVNGVLVIRILRFLFFR